MRLLRTEYQKGKTQYACTAYNYRWENRDSEFVMGEQPQDIDSVLGSEQTPPVFFSQQLANKFDAITNLDGNRIELNSYKIPPMFPRKSR